MKYLQLLVLCLLVLITSCNKSDDTIQPVDSNNLLIGHWSYREGGDNNQSTFQRVEGFIDDEYGVYFNYDNKFVERKNPGWCGTPPIVLENFNGTWQKNESQLTINVEDWNGTAKYKWEVIDLKKDKLVIQLVWDEYHQDDN